MSWRQQMLPGSYRRRLVDSLPHDTFIDLSKMQSINSLTEILIMSGPSVDGLPLEFGLVCELPFGSLDLISCGGLPCGYVVVIPRCERKIGRNNIALIRRRPIEDEVERLFDDGKLIVVGNDSAITAIAITRKWISP
jgi:hypothetical protein